MNSSISSNNSTYHSTPHTLLYVDINIKKFFHILFSIIERFQSQLRTYLSYHSAAAFLRAFLLVIFFTAPTMPSGM